MCISWKKGYNYKKILFNFLCCQATYFDSLRYWFRYWPVVFLSLASLISLWSIRWCQEFVWFYRYCNHRMQLWFNNINFQGFWIIKVLDYNLQFAVLWTTSYFEGKFQLFSFLTLELGLFRTWEHCRDRFKVIFGTQLSGLVDIGICRDDFACHKNFLIKSNPSFEFVYELSR